DDKVRLHDAYLRLGDTYFVSSNYNDAVKAYENAIKLSEIDSDYPFFQKAISVGYGGNDSKKISELEQFISKYTKSQLRDDAMYELGNSYVKANQTQKAMAMYEDRKSTRLNSSHVKTSYAV